MQKYTNFIAGKWAANSGRTFSTFNPADAREAVAGYADAGEADANAAVDAATSAYPAWAAITPVARGRILSKASQLIESRKEELAKLLTREEGKTLAESTGEVQRSADIFRFFGALGYTLGGQTIPHDLPGNLLYTRREPLGVVGLITPWNFPIAIPVWKLAPALLCGNAVVLKPSPIAPAMSFEMAKVLTESGLPAGVLNVITGEGAAAGQALAAHPKVVAVSFTGSYNVGSQVYQQIAPRMARAQMEMGGKNPTIVLADADLDLAANLIVRAGFGLTGQACTATSRVIVEKAVAAPLLDRLVAKANAMKVGNGLEAGIDMGPVVSKPQLDKIIAHLKTAADQGAKLLAGGKQLTTGPHANGYFVQPTVLAEVTPQMKIASDEVFGPVIAVMTAENFDHAITLANGVDVGLSASIVTRDLKKAMTYAERIEAGVVKINQISTGLALQAPFGGVKKSSTDSFKEQGAGAVEFYSKLKTIYLDYSA
jgi:acyl-CoA reductase-like NAD-dependent aldehyde dehydrogenase